MKTGQKLLLSSYVLTVLFSLGILLSTDFAHGGMPPAGVIYPGLGVDNIEIGKSLPARLPHLINENLKSKGIEIKKDEKNQINKIVVHSQDFYVEKSDLRVGDGIEDVFRYYGKGNIESVEEGLIIKYEEYGIEFVIDKKDERLRAIIIKRPVPLEFPAKDYKSLKRYYKQKK